MCGINGFNFQDRARLDEMHSATRHRGPDGEGFFESPEVSLAHNRLSIIDLSEAGRQPMSTKDGRFTIVFNGEIYNFKEIRSQLQERGVRCVTESDTEVLLKAFATWGEGCLSRLNGIFAFAMWDSHLKKLTLVRDRLGVKPLYYYWNGSRLIFSSEIKAILAHSIPRELDVDAFNQYFRFLYVTGERTMFKAVKKLLPGHLLTLQRNQFSIRRWWELKEGEALTSYEEAVERVRHETKAAIRRQLVSDRPLGIFLSGGIDSTSVLGVMSELGSSPVQTFSVGYETEIQPEKFNADADLAQTSAEYYGAEHHRFLVKPSDAISAMERVIWSMDEPVSNHIQTSTYLLAEYAKPHITVALGGDGGDELFGGYPRYWWDHMIARIRRLPIPFQQQIFGSILKGLGHPEHVAKFQARNGYERFVGFVMQKEADVSAVLRSDICRSDAATRAYAPYFEPAWDDVTNQMMSVDLQTWMPDESLVRTDKLTMAHGLEERVPILDHELVELSMRIPSKWKVGSRKQGKRVFIDAMKPYLPPHVLSQEKRGWFSPTAKWIRGPLLPFVREVLSPNFEEGTQDLFDFDAIERVLDDHLSLRKYGVNTIWSILTFQLWYRAFMRG